ncbi:MAG: hypothetical protein ACK55Z_04145 [bacterium]
MSHQTRSVRNGHTANNERAAGHERMAVVTLPDAERRRRLHALPFK